MKIEKVMPGHERREYRAGIATARGAALSISLNRFGNFCAMEIRAMVVADLSKLADIDATIESSQYLHLEKVGEGLSIDMRAAPRPLRDKLIAANHLGDELAMNYRQVAGGADEGIALAAEHDGLLVAAAVAQPRIAHGTLKLLDLRVDYDHRREGLATAMVFQIIAAARRQELRAVATETLSNNFPACALLLKCGFDLSGIDLRRHSNHDLVKETAALLWYAALD